MATLLLLNYNIIEKSSFIFGLTMFGAGAAILKSALVISYLGPWKRTETIDINDWKRRVILLLAMLNLTLIAISLLYDPKWYKICSIILLFILINCLTQEEIDTGSWKHSVVMADCWFTLVVVVIVFSVLTYNKYGTNRSKRVRQ